jgi:heptosyltransferase III
LIDIYKENYDAVIVFRSGYSKSAELFSKITNASYKVGVENYKGKDDFNIHISSNELEHEVEFCFACLKDFGIVYNNEKTLYFISEELSQKYSNFNEYTLFHISSRIKENKYSKKKYKELFDSLPEKKIIISAEPADFDMAKWLDENTSATFIKTKSLQDLGGLIKNVKLLVTLDGGAMHLGPAVGTKTISISGKTNMNKWYPWGYKDLVIQNDSRLANDIEKEQIIKVINN